jgi:hypothetical protein
VTILAPSAPSIATARRLSSDPGHMRALHARGDDFNSVVAASQFVDAEQEIARARVFL